MINSSHVLLVFIIAGSVINSYVSKYLSLDLFNIPTTLYVGLHVHVNDPFQSLPYNNAAYGVVYSLCHDH